MKQKTHRLLSLLLCLVMVLGLMPMTAFAGGTRKTAVNALYSPTAATSRLAPAFGAADVIGGLI